jgi:hypothetical protein
MHNVYGNIVALDTWGIKKGRESLAEGGDESSQNESSNLSYDGGSPNVFIVVKTREVEEVGGSQKIRKEGIENDKKDAFNDFDGNHGFDELYELEYCSRISHLWGCG